MPKSHPPYARQLRRRLVGPVCFERTTNALAEKYDPWGAAIAAYESAMCEDLGATLERELAGRRPLVSSVGDARGISGWVEGPCNSHRDYSALDHLSSETFDRQHADGERGTGALPRRS